MPRDRRAGVWDLGESLSGILMVLGICMLFEACSWARGRLKEEGGRKKYLS